MDEPTEEELADMMKGRSQHFRQGASKAKTAARKAAKLAQRKSFAELIADANMATEQSQSDMHISVTRAADGAPLMRVLLNTKDKQRNKKNTPTPDDPPTQSSSRLKRSQQQHAVEREGATKNKKARLEAAPSEQHIAPPKTGDTPVGSQVDEQQTVALDAIAPWTSFETIPTSMVPSALVSLLRNDYSFQAPTAIQAQAWPLVMSGRDVVGVSITGSGKTLGYLLPAFALLSAQSSGPAVSQVQVEAEFRKEEVTWAQAVPQVLVLAPTRELVQQIASEASRLAEQVSASVAVVYGGAPKAAQAKALREGAEVVVATPGRLQELLAIGPPPASWRPCVSGRGVHLLVLDEADRMLDMGFEPQITALLKHCPKGQLGSRPAGAARRRQTLLFTATWPVEVQRVANVLTDPTLASVIRVTAGGTCSAHQPHRLAAAQNIAQRVHVLEDDEAKQQKLLDVLRQEQGNLLGGGRMLIFVDTKKRCDQIQETVNKSRLVKSVAIHGDRDQEERDDALQRFRSGETPVLVATEVAARGLDVPGVSTVLVYDFPPEFLQYVHRIGRTGRAGAKGSAVCFFTPRHRRHAPALVQMMRDAQCPVPVDLVHMAKEVHEAPVPAGKKTKPRFVLRKGSAVVTGHNKKRNSQHRMSKFVQKQRNRDTESP